MTAAYLRELIDEHGRGNLIEASRLADEGISINAICSDLLLPESDVDDCILAGRELRIMAAEQRSFENAIQDG